MTGQKTIVTPPLSLPLGRVILLTVFYLVIGRVSHAQWKQILPPGVIDNQQQNFGAAVEYKAGKLWVGLSKGLYMSPDDGATWSQMSLTLGLGEIVSDISFFDAQNGLVAGFDSRLYATTDGGLSWRIIKAKPGQHCFTATYIQSSQRIVAGFVAFGATVDISYISISNDGGLTWDDSYQAPPGYLTHLQVSPGGVVGALLQNTPNGGQLLYSPDGGTTWIPTMGRFDSDSYSFRFDACEPNRVYVINDQLYQPTNPQTNIFYSSDLGTSWKSTVLQTGGKKYACGSILAPDHLLLYIQTLTQGLLRSTDGGVTWKSIGGPNGLGDSRIIASKDINTLFAAADDGSIWMTDNSGGDPVTPSSNGGQSALSLSDTVLFAQDTILPCALISDSNRRMLHLKVLGCTMPIISSERITGADSADYAIETPFPNPLTGNDSVVLVFKPDAVGGTDASYVITLADGRTITIKLSGAGKAPKPLTLTTVSSVLIDTLGEEITLPVSVLGLDKPTPVSLTVFYDPANLSYNGTTSLTGTPLDIPGSGSPGISKVLIPASDVNLTGNSAITTFRVFADSEQITRVRFELLTVVDSTVACAYTTDTRTVTTVTIPAGCGVQTVSYFLHHNKIPGFTISPNPTAGSVTLSVTQAVDNAKIDVIDQLGIVRESFERDLSNSSVFDLNTLPAGVYFIRVKAAGSIRTIPVILQK